MQNMLYNNIIDQMKEAQMKLGFAKETTRLYYPVASLNTLLKTDFKDPKEMCDYLRHEYVKSDALGEIQYAVRGGRIEVSIPPEGAIYVHEHVDTPAFLQDLIRLFMENHHADASDIKQVFAKHSEAFTCETYTAGDDFDEVIYFDDPSIDPYYYCIKEEMGHTIYHRFIKEDYLQLIE